MRVQPVPLRVTCDHKTHTPTIPISIKKKELYKIIKEKKKTFIYKYALLIDKMTTNTDYYQRKRDAFAEINAMFNEGKADDKIIFLVSMRYGFGENFVKKHLSLLRRLQEGE